MKSLLNSSLGLFLQGAEILSDFVSEKLACCDDLFYNTSVSAVLILC